jgi:hypothetical protein
MCWVFCFSVVVKRQSKAFRGSSEGGFPEVKTVQGLLTAMNNANTKKQQRSLLRGPQSVLRDLVPAEVKAL